MRENDGAPTRSAPGWTDGMDGPAKAARTAVARLNSTLAGW